MTVSKTEAGLDLLDEPLGLSFVPDLCTGLKSGEEEAMIRRPSPRLRPVKLRLRQELKGERMRACRLNSKR